MSGNNEAGQFGIGLEFETTNNFINIKNNIKTIICGSAHTFIISNDDSIFVAGNNLKDQLGIGESVTFTNRFVYVMKNITSINCGYEFSMIISNDGTLWETGDNNYGQLGLSGFNKTNQFVFITNDVKYVACG